MQQTQPFSSNRIIILDTSAPVESSRKADVLTRCDEWRKSHGGKKDSIEPLVISDAKIDVLLKLVNVLAPFYSQEYFEDWARRLILRENLSSTGLGGHWGLFHQFQLPEKIIETENKEADWWVFLSPEGVEFDAMDNEPVHVIFGFVMSKPDWGRKLEMKLLQDLSEKILSGIEDPDEYWKSLSIKEPSDVTCELNRNYIRCQQIAKKEI